jgi:Fis family transcriptional regulator, factor for inversion stimulation protein
MKKVVRKVAIKRRSGTVSATGKRTAKPAATIPKTLPPADSMQPLRECVRRTMLHYFRQLDGHATADLHTLVLREVEVPLLESVLEVTGGNQSQAALMLGLNRTTLRKKLRDYGLITD